MALWHITLREKGGPNKLAAIMSCTASRWFCLKCTFQVALACSFITFGIWEGPSNLNFQPVLQAVVQYRLRPVSSKYCWHVGLLGGADKPSM